MDDSPAKPYKLRALKGTNAGASMQLENTRLSFGQGKDCDIILQDTEIAETHIQTVFADGVLSVLTNTIKDQSHPVWLNGEQQKVFPFDVVRGDVLQLGNSLFAIGQGDQDWPNADELQLAVLPDLATGGVNKLASTHQRRLLWRGSLIGGGVLGSILLALLWHGIQDTKNADITQVNKMRSQLDFALRTNIAYASVRTLSNTNGLRLEGLVGHMDDFEKLQALAHAANVVFDVKNGQDIAQDLLKSLADVYPYLRADVELKTMQKLHIALKGVADDKAALIAAAEKVLRASMFGDSTLELRVSAVLRSYEAVRLHIQDALEEWPNFDTLEVQLEDKKFLLQGTVLDIYQAQLQSLLNDMRTSLIIPIKLDEQQLVLAAPPGELVGITENRLRYAKAQGDFQWYRLGEQITDTARLSDITQERALLEINGQKVAWTRSKASKRSVDLVQLHDALEKRLQAVPLFAELELQERPNRLYLRGGLSQAGLKQLQSLIDQLAWRAGARHKLLLDISEVPSPNGDIVTIFDGVTKAARLRQANGMERLVRVGESLGNGLTLLDIVDGTIRVQFGSVIARLDVG